MYRFVFTPVVFICCVAVLAGCGSEPAQQVAPQPAPQTAASPPPRLIVEPMEDCDEVLDLLLNPPPVKTTGGETAHAAKLTGGPVRFQWIVFRDFVRDGTKYRRIFFSRSCGPLVSDSGDPQDFGQACGYLVVRNWPFGNAKLSYALNQKYRSDAADLDSPWDTERGLSGLWEFPYSLVQAPEEVLDRKFPAVPVGKLAKDELKLLGHRSVTSNPGDKSYPVFRTGPLPCHLAAGETAIICRANAEHFSMALVVECLPFDQSVTEPSMQKKLTELRDQITQSPDNAELHYQAAMALHLLAHLKPHSYEDQGRRLSQKSVDRLSPLYQKAVEHLCVAMENEPYSIKYLGALREHLAKLTTLHSAEDGHVEAEGLYKRVLAIQERALGPEHPENATLAEKIKHISRLKRKAEGEEAADDSPSSKDD